MYSSQTIPEYLLADTIGLAVCGGNSSRMGTDKSLLTYYDKPQRYYVYNLLVPFCQQVLISCNEEQAKSIEAGYSFLTDQNLYNNIGPMAALLTAFTKFPDKNILLIGCDYPFLTIADLQQFATNCKEEQAISFYNKDFEIYEPLLAWYPNQCFTELNKLFEAEKYSLQHFLQESKAVKYYPSKKSSVESVDTREAYIKAYSQINP